MSDLFESLYTLITALIDHIEYCVDLLNQGISFVCTSFTWLCSVVSVIPAPVSGFFILFICLALLCLIFNR